MPNYKIPPGLRDHMINRAGVLAAKRVDLAHQDFPLTFDEVQDALMPEAQRKTIKKLIQDGIETFGTSAGVKFVAPKTHGIERAASVKVQGTKDFFFFKQAQWAYYSTQHAFADAELSRSDYYLDTEILSPEKQQALAAWVNNAVRERRMEAVTKSIVAWFLKSGCEVEHPTAAHVMARWPTLAMLVEGQQKHYRYGDRDERMHKARFREVPPKLDKWGWRRDDQEYLKRKKMIQVADMVLTSAAMLPEFEAPKDRLVAAVNNYEKFPGEKF